MGILAFLCTLRGVSACGLCWWQRVCLTAMLERERISFSKWHHIYQFLHNWSQLWLAETPEVCHLPDLLRLSDNTSGAFTVPALYPTASCTPGCLKEQHRPNPSCFFLISWDPVTSTWLTMEKRDDCAQVLHATWWVTRINHLNHLTYHYHHYQLVTSASWLPLVSPLSSIRHGRGSMALMDLVLCPE